MRIQNRMLRFLLLVLLGVVPALCGEYLNLYRQLGTELNVPVQEQLSLQKWLQQGANACHDAHQRGSDASLHCLREQIYARAGIEFDSVSAHSVLDLMPDHLLHSRKGSCVSISFLTMLLAERMGLAFMSVSLPGHVFLNFSGDVNWEPNRKGYRYTDTEYAVKYLISPQQFQHLGVTQFEGLFRYEMGNRDLLAGNASRALLSYQHAAQLWKDPRIAGNMAIVLDKLGKPDTALRILDSLWQQGERSEELVWNKSLLMIRAGNAEARVLAFVEQARGYSITSSRLTALAQRLAMVNK